MGKNSVTALHYAIPKSDGGIDLSLGANHIEDSSVSKAINMYSKNGVYMTRPALTANENDAFLDEDMNPTWDTEHIVTETFVHIAGKRMRVLYIKETDFFSPYLIHIYFLAADGTKQKAGVLYFSRADEESFFAPVNLLFFSAAPRTGGGIYLMVTKENLYDETEKSYQIFEISANLQSWNQVTSYHTPTVLINGRGSSYEYSEYLGFAFTGTPKILESKNLLNGSFIAYYTSDNYSASFRLPFSNLTGSVRCRVYAAPDIYTDWLIGANETQATETFYSARITLKIDRGKGIITFLDSNGQDYAFDRFGRYHENNIKITASQFKEEDFSDIVSCTCCAECGSKLIFSGGNQENRIYSVEKENPFYFSEGSSARIGEDGAIKAVAPCKGGFLAFKGDGVYAVRLTPGKAINTSSLLADDASIFYEKDKFSYAAVSGDSGCVSKKSVVISGKTPLWLGTDRRVHIYRSSDEKEESISEKIEPFLQELTQEVFDSCVIAATQDKVLLMFGNEALFLEYQADYKNRSKPAKWHLFRFQNTGLKGGIMEGEKIRMLCAAEESVLLYSALLAPAAADTVLNFEDDEITVSGQTIESSFTTKSFDFGKPQIRKFMESIQFSASCEGRLQILLNGKPLEILRLDSQNFGDGAKSVRIHPRIRSVQTAALSFSSDAPFSVSDILFTYRSEG